MEESTVPVTLTWNSSLFLLVEVVVVVEFEVQLDSCGKMCVKSRSCNQELEEQLEPGKLRKNLKIIYHRLENSWKRPTSRRATYWYLFHHYRMKTEGVMIDLSFCSVLVPVLSAVPILEILRKWSLLGSHLETFQFFLCAKLPPFSKIFFRRHVFFTWSLRYTKQNILCASGVLVICGKV